MGNWEGGYMWVLHRRARKASVAAIANRGYGSQILLRMLLRLEALGMGLLIRGVN
jgi:hypothetical protein